MKSPGKLPDFTLMPFVEPWVCGSISDESCKLCCTK